MMIITPNVKTPPAVTSGAFGFSFSRLSLQSRKDSSNDLLYDDRARV